MKKITIYNEGFKLDFGIDKVKYIIGSNVEKYKIWQVFHKTFKKVDDSEYQLDLGNKKLLLINGKELNLRTTKFMEIEERLDAEQELKLGSRATLKEYLTVIYNGVEYSEILNTINILLKDLESDLNERLTIKNIKVNLKELGIKEIIKLIEPKYMIDDAYASMYDLSYEDLIMFQINMFNEIAQKLAFEYFVMGSITHLTPKINNCLNEAPNNLKYIIFTNSDLDTSIKNILSIDKKTIDFADEIQIYNELVMEVNKAISLDEMKEELSKYIKNKSSDSYNHIKKIL